MDLQTDKRNRIRGIQHPFTALPWPGCFRIREWRPWTLRLGDSKGPTPFLIDDRSFHLVQKEKELITDPDGYLRNYKYLQNRVELPLS